MVNGIAHGKALRVVGAACAAAALVAILRAGHPEITTGPADSTWAPQGIRALATPAGLVALAFAAAAVLLFVGAARPRRRETPATFFDESERRQIAEAIAAAESRTSGEIRVHLEPRTTGDPLAAARAVFQAIGMTETRARNGVLVYLSVEERVFAIVGDQGIDRVVPAGFWDDVRARMEARFTKGEFAPGIVEAVAAVGEKLQRDFPLEAGDRNELSNEISTGEDPPRIA